MNLRQPKQPRSLLRERCEMSRTPIIVMLAVVVGMHLFQRWKPLTDISIVLMWGVLGLALLQIIATLNVVRRRKDAFRRAIAANNLLCPFCTYDLQGTQPTVPPDDQEPEMKCPECGAIVRVNDLVVAWDQNVSVSEVRAWIDSKAKTNNRPQS